MAGVEHFVQFSVTHPQLEPLLNHQAKLAVEREADFLHGKVGARLAP